MGVIPVQPVVIVNPCGFLTGIPLPLDIQKQQIAYTVNIPPRSTVTIITENPWSATNDRYIVWIDYRIRDTTDENANLLDNPDQGVLVNLIIDTTEEHWYLLERRWDYPAATTRRSIFAQWKPPQPFPVLAGERLDLDVYNSTDAEIEDVNGYIWFIEV